MIAVQREKGLDLGVGTFSKIPQNKNTASNP